MCEVKVKDIQSCPTLCHPMPQGLYSPWNSPGQNTGVRCLSLLQGNFPNPGSDPGLLHCKRILYQLSHQRSPRILDWVAFLFSRGIFPTQGLNPGLPHCRWILYQLSHQGGPGDFPTQIPTQILLIRKEPMEKKHVCLCVTNLRVLA